MSNTIKAIRYAKSGKGKTVMAATWSKVIPEGRKALVFDFDGDNILLSQIPNFYYITFKDTERDANSLKAGKYRTMPGAFMKADMMLRQLLDDGADPTMEGFEDWEKGERPWVIIVESLSGLGRACTNLTLQNVKGDTDPTGAPKGWDHWRGIQWYLMDFVHYLCGGADQGLWNLDVTAHEKVYENESSNIEQVGLKTIGQAREDIPALFDVFLRHEIKVKNNQKSFMVRTEATNRIDAKCRLGFNVDTMKSVLDEFELADWSVIYKKLEYTPA